MLPAYLQLKDWSIDPLLAQISVRLIANQKAPACPRCQHPARRIHSHYERTLADLPLGEYRVHWKVTVRKCFCSNADCKQRIFSERFAGLIQPWARKTTRMLEQLKAIALALAGRAGERLSSQLNFVASRETLLRYVRQLTVPSVVTPKVLGVDDWAFRKGNHYGTVLVDLERRQPIALLPDRTAETLAQWLKEHPGVEIITRDRFLAYKQGASEGAPNAIQVADRFHLLKNLADALEQTFKDYPQELKAAEMAVVQRKQQEVDKDVEVALMPLPPSSPADVTNAQRSRAIRLEHYEQTWEMHRQGVSREEIAKRLGINVHSVYRFLKHSSFPERQRRKNLGESQLNPYKPYLLERWNSGVRRVTVLYNEIRSRGYEHSYHTVARFLRSVKQAQQHTKAAKIEWLDSPHLPLTARRATWLVIGHAGERNQESKDLLNLLQNQCSAFEEASSLATEFTHMLREHHCKGFDAWLQRAIGGKIPALASFAAGLQEDYHAVIAGLTLPWSNGQVEGQVNRLKMLKRQMYGRASLDLLSKRFLLKH